MRQKYGNYMLFAGLVLIYLILAYKNPFTNRSQVPNLEPYPDSLYYSYPAWSFIKGTGFGMNFNTDSIPTIVPPGYSLWLMPFMALFNDVRAFYFANLILQLGTILFFVRSLKVVFKNNSQLFILSTISCFLLISNYYFYNLPSLLMAENLTLFTSTFGLYLLVSKISIGKSLVVGLVGILFWLIKLSNIPLGIMLLLLYGYKVWRDNPKIILLFGFYILGLTLFYYLFLFNQDLLKNSADLGAQPSFSFDYFQNNLLFYLKSLTGGDTNYLWYSHKFISPLLAFFMLIGIVIGLIKRQWRWPVCASLLLMTGLVLFMSFFITPDTRYLFSLLPLMILLFTIPLAELSSTLKPIIFYSFLVVFTLVILLVPSANEKMSEGKLITIKKQVGLNFKYTEDPWNYNAVVHMNAFFRDKPNAFIGTFLPPFYVAMFQNGTYRYLPISETQEFSSTSRPLVPNMYRADGSLPTYYRRLLTEGKDVYITNAYVNNVSSWTVALESLKQMFNATIASPGCLGTCDIYKLSLE